MKDDYTTIRLLLKEIFSKHGIKHPKNDCPEVSVTGELLEGLKNEGFKVEYKGFIKDVLKCPDCGNDTFSYVYASREDVKILKEGDFEAASEDDVNQERLECKKCHCYLEHKDGALVKVPKNKEEAKKFLEGEIDRISKMLEDAELNLANQPVNNSVPVSKKTKEELARDRELEKQYAEEFKVERAAVHNDRDHEPINEEELEDVKNKEMKKQEIEKLKKKVDAEPDEKKKKKKQKFIDRLIQNEDEKIRKKFMKKDDDDDDDDQGRQPLMV